MAVGSDVGFAMMVTPCLSAAADDAKDRASLTPTLIVQQLGLGHRQTRISGDKKYYLANLPAEIDLRTLAAAIKARWICEQAHQQLKEELGLDHFEGRSWQGLHRHALMTMIAYAFLQHRRLAKAGRGKKIGGHRLNRRASSTSRHRRTHRSTTASAMPHCRKWICNARLEWICQSSASHWNHVPVANSERGVGLSAWLRSVGQGVRHDRPARSPTGSTTESKRIVVRRARS